MRKLTFSQAKQIFRMDQDQRDRFTMIIYNKLVKINQGGLSFGMDWRTIKLTNPHLWAAMRTVNDITARCMVKLPRQNLSIQS